MTHSIAALRYRLLLGPVELEPLRVLDSQVLEWRGWRVTFCVLGASHAVCLERGSLQVTELLTCAPPAGQGQVLVEQAGETLSGSHIVSGVVECIFRSTVFILSHEDTGRTEASDREDAMGKEFSAAEQMAVAFPTDGSGIPVTRIGWQTEGERLLVETIHTYPEEGRGVRTCTQFQVRTIPDH